MLIDCASEGRGARNLFRFLRLMQLVVEKAELTRNTCLAGLLAWTLGRFFSFPAVARIEAGMEREPPPRSRPPENPRDPFKGP